MHGGPPRRGVLDVDSFSQHPSQTGYVQRHNWLLEGEGCGDGDVRSVAGDEARRSMVRDIMSIILKDCLRCR